MGLLAPGGFAFSAFCLADGIANFLGPCMWLITCFVLCTVGSVFLKQITPCCCDSKWQAYCMTAYCCVELFLIGVCVDLSLWHFTGSVFLKQITPYLFDSRDDSGAGSKLTFAHYNITKTVFALKDIGVRFEPGEHIAWIPLCIAFVAQFINSVFRTLIKSVIDEEAHKLEFESVEKAESSQELDKINIMKEIRDDVDSINFAIKELKVIGWFDRTARINVDLGCSLERVRDGIRPFRFLSGLIAWEFWWISDLAGRGFIACAILLILASGSMSMYFLYYRVGDISIFFVQSFMWYGMIFVVLSNSHRYFTEDAVEKLNMRWSTAVLQLVLFIFMFFTNIWHYCGFRRWFRTGDRISVCEEFSGSREADSSSSDD